MVWVVFCGTWFSCFSWGLDGFSKVACLWLGLFTAALGSGVDGFLVRLGVYGLGLLLQYMVQVVFCWGWTVFYQGWGLWFGLFGAAHRCVGLVRRWMDFLVRLAVSGLSWLVWHIVRLVWSGWTVFLASLGVYGLICSVGLVGGGRCFGEFGVYGFGLVGVAHRSVGLF